MPTIGHRAVSSGTCRRLSRSARTLRDAHQREVKTYEQSAAARERETKRAEKVITAAIEDQYKDLLRGLHRLGR